MRQIAACYTYYAKKSDENGDYFIVREGKPTRPDYQNFKFKHLCVATYEGGNTDIEVFIRVDIGKREKSSVITEGDYERVLSNALAVNAGKVKVLNIAEYEVTKWQR